MDSNLDKAVCTMTILCETSVVCLGALRQLLLASPPFCCLKRLVINSTSDGNKLFQREKGHMGVDRVLKIPLRRN